MVAELEERAAFPESVLAAMRTVPRHEFLSDDLRSKAYEDRALPLGPGQSISQPFVVATMTKLARLGANDRVLEVGTGSGYQAAVLAEITQSVFTIESNPVLARTAGETLARLCYRNVHLKCADGRLGWAQAAPFAAILVTACATTPPPALIEQLAVGGRLIAPIGQPDGDQVLRVHTKLQSGEIDVDSVFGVRFVPLA